jgi:hypothetical protein
MQSEQFQNPIEKWYKDAKSIPLTHKYMLCTIVVLFHIVYWRIKLNDFNHLISMSTPRHENASDVTKIKAAYPGYM